MQLHYAPRPMGAKAVGAHLHVATHLARLLQCTVATILWGCEIVHKVRLISSIVVCRCPKCEAPEEEGGWRKAASLAQRELQVQVQLESDAAL